MGLRQLLASAENCSRRASNPESDFSLIDPKSIAFANFATGAGISADLRIALVTISEKEEKPGTKAHCGSGRARFFVDPGGGRAKIWT